MCYTKQFKAEKEIWSSTLERRTWIRRITCVAMTHTAFNGIESNGLPGRMFESTPQRDFKAWSSFAED
jgi:hypothetical protein